MVHCLAYIRRRKLLETFAEEIRRSDKERTAITLKSWLKLAIEGIEPIAIQIVVIADIECRSRAGRPSEQRLAGEVLFRAVII